jgi:DNA-binding transcriptional MocR family regulator
MSASLSERVYRAITRYAFGEPVCWPSQQTIADELRCARESVNRAVRRLIRRGLLVILERRWSRRTGWCFNVYEIHGPINVDPEAARAITRRAHAKTPRFAGKVTRTSRYGCVCKVCAYESGRGLGIEGADRGNGGGAARCRGAP